MSGARVPLFLLAAGLFEVVAYVGVWEACVVLGQMIPEVMIPEVIRFGLGIGALAFPVIATFALLLIAFRHYGVGDGPEEFRSAAELATAYVLGVFPFAFLLALVIWFSRHGT